jgi:GntR family transcriptional regulator
MRQFETSKTPLPLKVQQHLFSLIEDGVYKPGEQLPSEVDLSAHLGISRPTLREALLSLEQEGMIVRKHGVGTFVATEYRRRLKGGLENLESILELATRQGMHVGFDDLQVQEEAADSELAARLQVPPGTPVTSIYRVITVDDVSAAYMFDVIPVSILSPEDVDENFTGLALESLRQKEGLQVVRAVTNVMAINADAFLADKLGIKLGQALLLLEETMFDPEDAVVEFSRDYFVPDFFHFYVVRR